MTLENDNLIYAKNRKDDSVEMFLFGGIGDKIDGDRVAEEIRFLSKEVSTIFIKINSGGGSIISGLSIISAILNSEATIVTVNEGIAASMAGVILITGDKVEAKDFSRLMLHEPSLMGETIETTKDEKTKNTLTALKSQLVTIISKRTGRDEKGIDEMLSNETWLTATQAKRGGLIDKIIPTKKRMQNMTANDILLKVAAYHNFENKNITNTNPKTKKMELINNHLGLTAEANEATALDKIKEIEASNVALGKDIEAKDAVLAQKDQELETLKNEKAELETKVTDFEAKEKELNKQLAVQIVEDAIKEGKFDEKDKEALTAQAENDVEAFKVLVNSVKAPEARITDHLNTAGTGTPAKVDPENKETWGHKEWEKNDPNGLRNILDTDPEKYQELYERSYPKN